MTILWGFLKLIKKKLQLKLNSLYFLSHTSQLSFKNSTSKQILKTHSKTPTKRHLRAYSAIYWDVYNETEECNLWFAINTFKMGLLKDENGIYNALTRQPPITFDELLSRVNEYARVEIIIHALGEISRW